MIQCMSCYYSIQFSLLFSRFVDGIVLVVEAEATSRNDIKLAIDRIGKEHLIGTILNKARE